MSGLADVRRYDGAVVARGRRDELVPCSLQPRDIEVIDGVRRHKFLTAPQILELWWPGGTPQVGRRRLRRLFEAGHLDRFRPVATGGSFPWTYQLGREGHRLLQATSLVERGKRFEVREVYDYRYVLHELHLNAWVLAWRRLLGCRLLAWEGEMQIDPPAGVRKAPLRIRGEETTLHGLKDDQAKPLRPDDLVEVVADDGALRLLLIDMTVRGASTRTSRSSAATTASCAGGGPRPASPKTSVLSSSSCARTRSTSICFSTRPTTS